MALGAAALEPAGRVAALASALVSQTSALPRVAAVALVAVGLIIAVLGSRAPVVRIVALLGGAGVGLAVAPLAAQLGHFPEASLRWPLVAALAVLGAVLPEAVVFLVAGGLLGIVGTWFFDPSDRAIAFFPGFLLGGAAGAIFFPWIAAVLTGLAGGLAVAFGLSACAPGAMGAWLVGHPMAVAGLGMALGVSGAVAQFSLPDEVQKQVKSADDARRREIRRSEKARDKRFAEYSRKARGK